VYVVPACLGLWVAMSVLLSVQCLVQCVVSNKREAT